MKSPKDIGGPEGRFREAKSMKAAILGCVHLHSVSYTHALKRLGVEIIGVCEKDTAAAKAFAADHGVPYFEDAGALLAQKPDFVVICSENVAHKEYTLMAAKQGIHVVVEKPIATTIADSEEMIACCKENGVKLMVCFPVRYTPCIMEAKKNIDEGKIGDIVSIIGTNHGSMPGGWFIDKEKSGGGAVLDHTVHVADVIHWVMGNDVVDVKAVMDTLIHPIPTEDCGLVMMEFDNGVVASIDTSWNRPKAFPTWGDVVIDFVGTKCAMRVDAFLDHLNVYSNNETKMLHSPFGKDMDYEMLKDFVDAVQNDRPSPVTGEDGLFALKVALMAYENNL